MRKWIRKLLNKETVTYIIFGVLTTVVNFAAFRLLTFIPGLHYLWANAFAWVIAVAFAFVTNKQYVFESKTWTWKTTLQEGASFTGSRVLTLLIEQGGLLLLVGSFKMDEMLAKVLLSVIVVILNYVFSKLWVFVQRDNKK